MRIELIVSETGRRGAEITVDGLGDLTIYKKRVTRHDATAFDARVRTLSEKIMAISKKLGKAKGAARDKLTEEMFDANAEFICARVDGITPEQIAIMDTSDVAELSMLANDLFKETFDAKKNV